MFYNDQELGLLTYKKINAPVLDNEGSIQFCSKDNSFDFTQVNWKPDEYRKYRDDEVGRLCKKYGAKKVVILSDSNPVELDVPECRTHVYYNGKLNRAILLYRITKDERYIREMAKENFLIPIRILTSKTSYPEIKYLSATIKKNDFKYHVLFSDHEEYNKWRKATGGAEFNDVILITAAKLFSLDTAHGGKRNYELCINPYGNMLVLEKDSRKIFYQTVKEKRKGKK